MTSGRCKDGVQERYLSYYGIRRSIKDGATLEVHYIRDRVPFDVDEEQLNVGYEQMCAEMELEDEEAKDFVQRKRARWKEIATLPERVDIVLDKMLEHFLAHPDPSGFKAQLVAVDRKRVSVYKDALDQKLRSSGLPGRSGPTSSSQAPRTAEPTSNALSTPSRSRTNSSSTSSCSPRSGSSGTPNGIGSDPRLVAPAAEDPHRV